MEVRWSVVDDGEDIFFAHEQDVFALGLLEFVSGPVREEDDVAFLDLERSAAAVLEQFARPDGEDLAFLRFVEKN